MWVTHRPFRTLHRISKLKYSTPRLSIPVNFRGKAINVYAQENVPADHHAKAVYSVPFTQWLSRLEKINQIDLKEVLLQSVDMFGLERVGFIKFKSTVFDRDGETRTVVTFMRGGSVAILVVLSCEGKDYTLLVTQDSIPTAQPWFPALPAGMLDGNGNFSSVAARELQEETGIIINSNELTDLTGLAYGTNYEGMYVSVGGTDEFIRLYYYRKEVSRKFLQELEGKLTGLPEEHEKITLKVVPLEDLWKFTSDSKCLGALCLYENLKREGRIK